MFLRFVLGNGGFAVPFYKLLLNAALVTQLN